MGKRARARAAKLGDGADAAPVTTAVAPLACPKCGAPVPLGGGEVATCGFCQTVVPLPADYRALRDANREQTADRREAEALYRKLGTEPSRALRAWASAAELAGGTLGAIVIGILYVSAAAAFLAGFALEILLHWMAPLLGIDLIDRFGGGTVYAGFVVAAAVFGLLPNWLVHYFDTSAEIRRTLQANLAARPPEKPGFPSTCRICGAGLDVPPDALGVRCAYCQADNLVALPSAWVKSSSGRQASFHRSIVDAASRAAALRTAARSGLPRSAIWVGVVAIAFGVLGHACVAIDRDREITSFGHSMGPPRTMTAIIDKTYEFPERKYVVFTNYSPYTVALHKGELLQLESPDAGSDVTVTGDNTTTFPLVENKLDLGWHQLADGAYGVRYRAPYTGLFNIGVTGIDAPMRLRWSIGPAVEAQVPPAPPLRVEDLAAAPPPPPLTPEAQAIVDARHARLAVQPPGRPDLLVTSITTDGVVKSLSLTSVASGKEITSDLETTPISAFALTADGRRMVVDTDTDLFLYTIPPGVKGFPLKGVQAGLQRLTAIVFVGPHVFAAGDASGHIRAWDLDSAIEQYEIGTVPGPVTSLAMSADGTALTASYVGGARRWTAASAAAWTPAPPAAL